MVKNCVFLFALEETLKHNFEIKSMYTLKIPVLLFFTSVILNGCGLLEGDSDTPMWAEENLHDFVLYGYSPDGDSFAVIDLETGEILRHMNDFKGLQSVISNKDGSLIYISTFRVSGNSYVGEIYKMNTSTWTYEIIYNQAAHLLENRNEGLFFITKGTTRPLSKRMFGEINPSTGEVTEIDSVEVDWGAYQDDRLIEIHPNKSLLYAVNGNGKFYQFDYATSTTTYIFPELPFPPLANITLSGDGTRLYIPGGPVLDLVSEEIVGRIPVWRLGSAAARKDDKEVYITDPGGYIRDPNSQNQVFIYSPQGDSLSGTIEVGSMTDQIYLTPKERYAVVNDWIATYFVIDLKERKVIKKQQYTENNVVTLLVQGMYLAPKPPSLK